MGQVAAQPPVGVLIELTGRQPPVLSAIAVSQVGGLVRGQSPRTRGYLILSPYPGLPAPVVASAWGKQLHLAGASDPRLPQFITTYAQGSQTPDRGATCSGGTRTPCRDRTAR